MARVTVEDCILKIPNRFDLVVIAGQRARDISSGAPLTVDRDRDKNPVVALREIADETVDLDELREALVKGLQKQVEVDLPEEDMEFDAAAVTAAMIAPGADDDDAPAEDDLDLDAFARELAAEAGGFRSRSDQD